MMMTLYFDDYNMTDTIMMSSDDNDDESSSTSSLFLLRFLQQTQGGGDGSTNRGRTVLTVLYLCVLTMCFIVPVFFYCRMQCDHRNDQQLREIEVAGLQQAMTESQNAHREESRATRRKYREERRARIIQLFMPTRMILNIDNFPQGDTNNNNNENDNTNHQKDDIENPTTSSSTTIQRKESQNEQQDDDDDDDDTFVLIPEPGIPKGSLLDLITTNPNIGNNNNQENTTSNKRKALRLVQNECSICLCEYNVGDDVVWSSNPQCDHVFHETCIEQWLMKQRDGPLCPCCRRDFVIDPFDFGDDDDIELGIISVRERIPSSTGRMDHEEMEEVEEEEEAPEIMAPNATIQTMESDVMSDVPATTEDGNSSADNSDNIDDVPSGTR